MPHEIFNKLIKSKMTIIFILIIVVIGIFSFYNSWTELNADKVQLENPAEDLNVENVEKSLRENKASNMLIKLLYLTLSKELIFMSFLVFIGLFLGNKFNHDLTSGYGNLMMTRLSYSSYVKNIISAHRKYLFVLTFVPFIMLYVIAFIVNGFDAGIGFIGEYELGGFQVTLLYFGQIFLWFFYFIVINEITLFVNVLINNKYIIQAVPSIGFGVLPIFLGSAIPFLGVYLSYISIFSLNNVINRVFNNKNPSILVELIIGYAFILVIHFVFYRLNSAKYTENYIQ